jgi:hypothetical protein
MKMIINIQDTVNGSWHQLTAESGNAAGGILVRLDGTVLPYDLEVNRQIRILLGAWEDEFEGVTDKEAYL